MQPTTATSKPVALSLSSVQVELNLLTVPTAKAQRGNKWVLLGEQHSFMPKLLALIRRSPTAGALFGRIASLVSGDGFRVDEQALPALATFLKKVAHGGRHRTGDKLLKRVVKDYTPLRGVAMQVIWASDGRHIAELYHQPFETVACSPMNADDEVETYWLCRDWSQQSKYRPQQIPAYNPERAQLRLSPTPEQAAAGLPGNLLEPVQLFYYAEEGAGKEYYPDLDYEAALPYIQLEGDLATFHSTNVASGFSAQTLIQINKGPEDRQDENGNQISAASQRKVLEDKMSEKFSGPGAQKIMYMWGDGSAEAADKMAKITSLPAGNPETYDTYAALAQQAILSACSCTSPMVAGLPSEGGGALGGNGQELYQSFKLFFNSRCLPDQGVLLEIFKELFGRVAGVSFETEPAETPWLDIMGSLPVEYTFSETLMELIMTDDELRAKIGLKPLPAGARPASEPTPAAPA
jgi:hypothetical protein